MNLQQNPCTSTEMFWPYINQLLTVLNDSGTKNEVKICESKV